MELLDPKYGGLKNIALSSQKTCCKNHENIYYIVKAYTAHCHILLL